MRILVSGGGTGGHISPVLAVISELQKLDNSVEILYVGSISGLESNIIPQSGYNFKGIRTGKFRRYHKNKFLNIVDPRTVGRNLLDLVNFGRGYFEAKNIISDFDPDVVFCKGGYVSLPVGLAAHSLGYPLVIHESDSIMGLSNKLLAEKSDKVCVSYPTKIFTEIKNKSALVFTGNPVREDIFSGSKQAAKQSFNLDNDLPVVMVIGGSQGALIINQTISESLKNLLPRYQVIHVSGERDYDWLLYRSKKLDSELLKNYHLFNYLSGNLKDAYAASDLVVSRAGNNVIAELGALKKATILIPITNSANGHQLSNAKIITRQGASYLIMEENLSPKVLTRKIDYLFENKEELEALREKIATVNVADAAARVAEEIRVLVEADKQNNMENDKEA